MSLKTRRQPSVKFRLLPTLIAILALLAQPLYSVVAAEVASAISAPAAVCTYDFTPQKMWEVTWGYDFANRNGGAPVFTMQSNGGLVSLNGGSVPSYMGPTWHWLYVTEGNNRHFDYGFADGTIRTVDVTFSDVNGCQIPTIVWGMNTTSTTFVNDPKYVRENNGGDLSAQLVTPDSTTDVNFFVDGNTSTPFPGSNIGGAGATTSWWRLYTPLTAGMHTITAQIKIDGAWYGVNDSAVAYSLDAPTASYVIPTTNQFFRANDRVVRVMAEDEFDQFDRMVVKVGSTTTTVNRVDCSDKGLYVLCDVSGLGLAQGTYKAKTTTYTKANNRVDNLMSEQFTIDNSAPVLTNLTVENQNNGFVGDSIIVSANASDNNGVESVNFYVTEPRTSDGVCTGNGAKLTDSRVSTTDSDGKYRTTLDVSTLNGDYCVTAVPRDAAKNNGTAKHKKVSVDNQDPVITLNSVASAVSNVFTVSGTASDTDGSGLRHSNTNTTGTGRVRVSFRPINSGSVGAPVHTYFVEVDVSGNWTLDVDTRESWFAEGQQYRIIARANDSVGATYADSNTSAATADTTIDNIDINLSDLSATQNIDGSYTLSVRTDDPATPVKFSLDGATISGETTSDGGTTWRVLTAVLAGGTSHTFSATSTDGAGHSTTVGSSFIVPLVPATPPSITPTAVPSATTVQNQNQTNTNTQPTTNEEVAVLGEQTDNNAADAESTLGTSTAAISPSSEGWKIFGLAWYWWLLILAALAAGIWWLIARHRRSGEEA